MQGESLKAHSSKWRRRQSGAGALIVGGETKPRRRSRTGSESFALALDAEVAFGRRLENLEALELEEDDKFKKRRLRVKRAVKHWLSCIAEWMEERRWNGVIRLLAIVAAGCLVPLSLFLLWLRPELLGYQFYMVPFKPDCFIVQRGFKTGGNANRMEALYHAIHLAEKRNFRYIALPADWQAWLCKVYSVESIHQFPIPLVPREKDDIGCEEAFKPLADKAIRDEVTDVCEEWHLANFFRLPWYREDIELKFSYWKYFLPTGKDYEKSARKRIEGLHEQHPNKKIVTVHKRWLSVWCSTRVNLEKIDQYPMVEKYCHMTPRMVTELLEREVGIESVENDAHIVISSDHYMQEEDTLFTWEFESESMPFMAQVWTWILSDVHIGHPNSTMDHMACRFRKILFGQNDSFSPCFPVLLQDRVMLNYNER